MDTQDLLTEVGEQDPEAAIDMMKLLLDTVGDRLQDREVAEQLLVWDMDGLLRNPAVQEPLLQRLKQDDILAQQIFQSAYLDTGQQMLYEACDFYGEAELEENFWLFWKPTRCLRSLHKKKALTIASMAVVSAYFISGSKLSNSGDAKNSPRVISSPSQIILMVSSLGF